MSSEQTNTTTGRGRPFSSTAIGDSSGIDRERGPLWMCNFARQVDIGYRKFWAKRGIDITQNAIVKPATQFK